MNTCISYVWLVNVYTHVREMNWILSFLFIYIITTSASGDNGCKDQWTYFGHAHTCVRFFNSRESWSVARSQCIKYWNGTLIKIDDVETDEFVKGLLGRSRYAWIGLNDQDSPGVYRWQGFPGEVPKYNGFKMQVSDHRSGCVYMSTLGWMKTTDCGYETGFVCQYMSEMKKTEMTCPSPVRQNRPLPKPVSCHFHYKNWQSVFWYVRQSIVADCNVGDSSCQTRVNHYNASENQGLTRLSYDDVITRRHEGPWKCLITSTTGKTLVMKTCDMRVYEPPSDIECSSNLDEDMLKVICKTGKIYPKAACKWSYRNQNDISFKEVSPGEVDMPTEGSDIDNSDKQKYFMSKCSVTLTKRGTVFEAGQMTIQAVIYPNISGADLFQSQEASSVHLQQVLIEHPEKPHFKVNGSLVGPSVSLLDRDALEIRCGVKSGKPLVQSVTLACDFSIDKYDNKNRTWPGNSVKTITLSASPEMDGKNCTCWGQHMTGKSDITKLSISVFFPANVDTFKANRHVYQLTVNPGVDVQLKCSVSGSPTPTVDILKLDDRGDTILTSSQTKDYLELSFRAKCQDNGRYQCRVHNQINEIVYEDGSRQMPVYVRCPPTACAEQRNNPRFVVSLGNKPVITLCVVAYPAPDARKVQMQKDGGMGWAVYSKLKYKSIEPIVVSKLLQGVRISFNDIESSDFGDYRLYYERNDQMSIRHSFVYFHLAPKGPPDCPDNVTVTAEGHNSAAVSWLPGYDNGYTQSFILSRRRLTPMPQDQMTKVIEIQDRGKKEMTYFLTGLQPGSEYSVSVVAKNQEGMKSCPSSLVNVTTESDPSSTSENNNGGVVAAVVVVIIIIIFIVIVVAAVFYFRRKKYRSLKDNPVDTSASSTGACEYANHEGGNQGAVRILRNKEDRSDPELRISVCEYANHDRGNQGPVRLILKRIGPANGESKGSTNDIENNLSEERPYSNVGLNVYSNASIQQQLTYDTSNIDNVPEDEASAFFDNDSTFSDNDTAPPSPSMQPVTPTVEMPRKNTAGLIYVDVVIDPATNRTVLQDTSTPPKLEQEEPVEYTSIDLLATAEVNTDHQDNVVGDENEDTRES